MANEMRLAFATIACDRCGGERLMTQPCPGCGRRPREHETQPDLARRRRILAAFEAAEPTAPLEISTDIDRAFSEIPILLTDVQKALARAARDGRSADELILAFSRLDAQVVHWSRRRPRPDTNRARSLGRSLALLRQGLSFFATALGAPTLIEAQARETEGQQLIDAAVAEIEVLQEISESDQILTAPERLGLVGVSARAAAGGDAPLATLDARLQRSAGRDPASSSAAGLGLQLHLFRHLMLSVLDLEECLQTANFAEQQMGDLSTICRNPKWQARNGVVAAQFSTLAFNLSNLDGSTDLEAAAAALQLVMQCRDGVIRHCLATLLAKDAEDFERLMQEGAGAVIKAAAKRHPELKLDENLSQVLRHAGAHFDYDIEGDHFVTHTSSGSDVRLTTEDFLDQVLGYLQTSVALMVALASAASTQGVELEVSKHTPERDLLGGIKLLLGFAGFLETTVSREEETLHLVARGETATLVTVAAGIAGIAPEGIGQVSASITEKDGGVHSWQAPLEPFRRYLQRPPGQPDVDETLSLVRAISSVRIDAQPLPDEEDWARVARHVLNDNSEASLRVRVLRAKEMRDLARSAGQDEVAELLTAILQAMREGREGPDAAPSVFGRQTRST